MFCKNCGNPLNEMEKFCTNCGFKVADEPIAYQTNSYYQEQQPTKKPIKKAGLLIWSILEILSCLSFLPGLIALIIWCVSLKPAAASGDETRARRAKTAIKCTLWIGIALWIIVIGILGVNILKSSGKKPVTIDEFYSQIETTDYKVYEGNETLYDLYVVCNDSGTRIVEFYRFNDDASASQAFYATKERFEEEKGNFAVDTNVEFTNYSKYTLETSNSYKALTRIEDTLLYADVNSMYKDEVEDIFEELGY